MNDPVENNFKQTSATSDQRHSEDSEYQQNSGDIKKPSFWQLIKSAAAAAIGVQSDKNREFDFSQTSIVPYIVVGIAFTIAFVAGLMFIVSLIV